MDKLVIVFFVFVLGAGHVAQGCLVGNWSSWTKCDAVCGLGVRTRSRSLLGVGSDPSEACPALVEIESCVGASPCFEISTPPLAHASHKLRACETRLNENPIRYSFVPADGNQTIAPTVGFTCMFSPCPPLAYMPYNAAPCFNITSAGAYMIADTASSLGLYNTLRSVNFTTTYRHCTSAERETHCGGSGNTTGCIMETDTLSGNETFNANISLCAAAPTQNETWMVCPGEWAKRFACTADDRECVWADSPSYSSVSELMQFKCPWSGGNWTDSNVPDPDWAVANILTCTAEESVAQCGREWTNRRNSAPCTKSYSIYNELGGHEWVYDTTECLRAPCTGAQQLVQCNGNFSHQCTSQCNIYGQCEVSAELSSCTISMPRPARKCTDAELARTEADPESRDEQCAVMCDDSDLTRNCDIYVRYEGLDWILLEYIFERPFRMCVSAERNKYACSTSESDCAVMCDDLELTENCQMYFKCPPETTVFLPSTTIQVDFFATPELSAEQCGDAWAEDPQKTECRIAYCDQRVNGVYTDCACDLRTCNCPFSFPDTNDTTGEYVPCAAAYAIIPCAPASRVAQQVCGVDALTCSANCTGLYFEPTCSAPIGTDGGCTCGSPQSSAPLYGLACNGEVLPCTSEEFNTCGAAAVSCRIVTEFVDESLNGRSISLNDPDSDAKAIYTACGCHVVANATLVVETQTGDEGYFCGNTWDVDLAAPNSTRMCNATEVSALCGVAGASCLAVRVANNCTSTGIAPYFLPFGDVTGNETCFDSGVFAEVDPEDATYHWELLAGTCMCDNTSVAIDRPRSERKNGKVCPGPTAQRECTLEEEAALRLPCLSNLGGACRMECNTTGCIFNATACYPGENGPRTDCTHAERINLCGEYAIECEVELWWPDGVEPSLEVPMIPVPETQVCNIRRSLIRTCTLQETINYCQGNNLAYAPPHQDSITWYPDYPSSRLCSRPLNEERALDGTCPGAISELRYCNRTEAYMYCGADMYPTPESVPDWGEEDTDPGCILACPDTDNVQEGDRVNACRLVGICTTPNDTQEVTNPVILQKIMGDVGATATRCTVRMLPHPELGVHLGMVALPATDCDWSPEYYALFDHEIEEDPDLVPEGPLSEVSPLSSIFLPHRFRAPPDEKPADDQHPQRHRIRNAHMWRPAFHPSHTKRNIHHHQAWHGRLGHRGRQARGTIAASHRLDVHVAGMHPLATETNVTISKVFFSTNTTHTSMCGPLGSTLTVGVLLIQEQGVAQKYQFIPETCVCNFTAGWYANDDASACIEFHIRNCTEQEAGNRPASCTGVCTVRCRRTRIRNNILFGAETCYAFGDDPSCFDTPVHLENEPFNTETVKKICGPVYGLRGSGRCKYRPTYPVPEQDCVLPGASDYWKFTFCQCTSTEIRYIKDGYKCGSAYTIVPCRNKAEAQNYCGIYGTACGKRCLDTQGNNCDEAEWCQCSKVSDTAVCADPSPVAGKCNRYTNCGIGTLNTSGVAAAPTCDPLGYCGPLTQYATFQCDINKPLEEACFGTGTSQSCVCQNGAAHFGEAKCWGFTRRCEPRERVACVAAGVCKNTTKPLLVHTSCNVTCSAADPTNCPYFSNPVVVASDPLPAAAVLDLRGVPYRFSASATSFPELLHIRVNDPRIVTLKRTTDSRGLLECPSAMVLKNCGQGGVSCKYEALKNEFVRNSCKCKDSRFVHYASVARTPTLILSVDGKSTLLPDSGHECIEYAKETFTTECSNEERINTCGIYGVQKCTRSWKYEVIAKSNGAQVNKLNMRCDCWEQVMSSDTPGNNLFYFTHQYQKSGSGLTTVWTKTTTDKKCHPDWEDYRTAGIFSRMKVYDDPGFANMSSIPPLLSMGTTGTCPMDPSTGVTCSAKGRCRGADKTGKNNDGYDTKGPYPPFDPYPEINRMPNVAKCSKDSDGTSFSQDYAPRLRPIDYLLRGWVQKSTIKRFGVYFVDITEADALEDNKLWQSQYCNYKGLWWKAVLKKCITKTRLTGLARSVVVDSWICNKDSDYLDVEGGHSWEIFRNLPNFGRQYFDRLIDYFGASAEEARALNLQKYDPFTVYTQSATFCPPYTSYPSYTDPRQIPNIWRYFTNLRDAVVVVPHYDMPTFSFNTQNSFSISDPFPLRWNGYCAIRNVPYIYTYNTDAVHRDAILPFTENYLDFKYEMSPNYTVAVSGYTLSMTDTEPQNVSIPFKTGAVTMAYPLGHPFATEWRIFTGQQIKSILRTMMLPKTSAYCKAVEQDLLFRDGVVLNGMKRGSTQDEYKIRWKRNTNSIQDTRLWCNIQRTVARYINAKQGQWDFENEFKDNKYYFGANPVGPLILGRKGKYFELLDKNTPGLYAPLCILGPGIDPPRDNIYCQNIAFRSVTQAYKSIIINGKELKNAIVGALWHRGGDYKCYMLRNKDPLQIKDVVQMPCKDNTCTCEPGWEGDDCSLYRPAREKTIFPVYNRKGQCENGRWELVVHPTTKALSERCVCKAGWSAVGGVCVWNSCKDTRSITFPTDRNKWNETATKQALAVPACSDTGICTGNASTGSFYCDCNPGYSGTYCQKSWYYSCPKNNYKQICSKKGVCVPTGVGSEAQCICHEGAYGKWYGAFCEAYTLYEPDRCNTTNGGVVTWDRETLDVFCNCTNSRYTGPFCTLDKCPKAYASDGSPCSSRAGYECVENKKTSRWECVLVNGTNITSMAQNRYAGCALETDLYSSCGTGDLLCGDIPSKGRPKCISYIDTETKSVAHKCACEAGETGDRCESNVCRDPIHTVPGWQNECHGIDGAQCIKSKTVQQGGGCQCPISVSGNTTAQLYVGQYCQYEVAEQCGMKTLVSGVNRTVLCSGRGTCECSGILNGTHCVGGTFGCVCGASQDGGTRYGGQFCEGACSGTFPNCGTLNLCPASCGEHGECKLDGTVHRCVCKAGVKYKINNSTGECTWDKCASGEDAAKTEVSNPDWVVPISAHVDPNDPTQCVCDNELMEYPISYCKTAACPRSPSGWICGDPMGGWEERLDPKCRAVAVRSEDPLSRFKLCDESKSILRQCASGQCFCKNGYTLNATSGLCVAYCNPQGTLRADLTVGGIKCTCATGWTGTKCTIGPCPTTTGQAKYVNGNCTCNSPWINDINPPYVPCSTRDCNQAKGGRYNSTTGLCQCKGVYTGEKCYDDICGDNGAPSPTNTSKCVCDFGWAGTLCDAQICAPEVARFTGVDNTTGIVICTCLNEELVYNRTTKTCEGVFENPPPVYEGDTSLNQTERENGTNTGTDDPPYEEPVTSPDPDNSTIVVGQPEVVYMPYCSNFTYNSTTQRCNCLWLNETYHACFLYSYVTLDDNPFDDDGFTPAFPVEESSLCRNGGGLAPASQECNCTGTNHTGPLCEIPLCGNGCQAKWGDYDGTGVMVPRCFPPVPLPENFPWSRNFSHPNWNCTISACGPGGTPVSGVCSCSAGYVYSPSRTPQCVKICNLNGNLRWHPETGECICRQGYSGSQCTARQFTSLSLKPRYFKVTQYQSDVFAEENSYTSVTKSRFAEVAVSNLRQNFSIPSDLHNELVVLHTQAREIDEWVLINVPPSPDPPAPPPTRRTETIFTEGAAVAVMSISVIIVSLPMAAVWIIIRIHNSPMSVGYSAVQS